MATRLIAHRLDKKQHSKDITRFLREGLIEDSLQSQKLLAELRKAVTRRSHPGKFADVGGGKPVFQQRLERYLKKMTDTEFVSLSHDLTRLLETAMKEQAASTGGSIVFAEHDFGEETLLLVALLSNEARTAFDKKMNPVDSPTIDFEHLRHGVRVRHSGIAANEPGLLQFVAQKSDGVSDYFQLFIGCEKLPDTSEQGRNLIEALKEVATQQNRDIEDIKMVTHSYWITCKKEKRDMSLDALANLLNPEDPVSILTCLTNEKNKLAGNFAPPPPIIMNRLIKFTYHEDGLKLELDKQRWSDNIKINGQNVQIKNAPPSLISRIQEELLQ